MKFRPSQIVLFLAAYLPLEEFILKWMPVSDSIFLLLRQIPDLLILLVGIIVLCNQISRWRGLRGFGRPFDGLIVAFILAAFISLVLNKADIIPVIAHLKALLRYVFLAYIIHTFTLSVRDKERLIRILIFGVIVQISLGLSQIVGGVPLRDFLGARNTTSELAGFKADFTGTRFEDVNNLMGTMGNTIDYGAFLLVGVALFLCVVPQRRRVARLIGISMSLLCIFLTNSRSAIIASVVILFVYTYMEHGRRRALVLGTMVATCLSVVLLVLPIYQSSGDINSQYSSRTRFFDMFTSDYVQEAMNQRLGLVVYVVPDFFADVSSVAFGYTPDPKVYLVAAQKRFPHIPDSLLLDLAGIIEDVYWLALMIYFGVIGFALFAGAIAWAIHALARAYRKEIAPDRRRFILFALLLMVSSIPLNCFNQVFLMRQFSLCLWTTFALALSTQKEEFHAYSSST